MNSTNGKKEITLAIAYLYRCGVLYYREIQTILTTIPSVLNGWFRYATNRREGGGGETIG
jgi:hypothetical protein